VLSYIARVAIAMQGALGKGPEHPCHPCHGCPNPAYLWSQQVRSYSGQPV